MKDQSTEQEEKISEKKVNSFRSFDYKKQLKKFGRKIFVNKIFFGSLLLIILVFSITFIKTVNAKPGELFFFPRTIYERTIYNQNEELDVLKLLKNRKEAFVHYQDSGKCVEARIAEDELLDKYQLANTIVKNTSNSQEKIRILSSYLETFNIEESQMNCDLIVNLLDLQQIWEFILLNYSDNSNAVNVNFLSRANTSQQKFDDLKNFIQTNSNFDQERLNQINNLLIYVENNTIEDELTFNSYIKLINTEFALSAIQNIIENREFEDNWSAKIVILCNNIEDKTVLCSQQELISNINSIQNQTQYVNRIENGSLLFRRYLEEGFI